MELIIRWPESLRCPHSHFQSFVQKMANRILQGHARYGLPHARARYLTRLELELKAYKKTGNAEHLINAANYCALECEAPENPKFHFNPLAVSATRSKVKK